MTCVAVEDDAARGSDRSIFDTKLSTIKTIIILFFFCFVKDGREVPNASTSTITYMTCNAFLGARVHPINWWTSCVHRRIWNTRTFEHTAIVHITHEKFQVKTFGLIKQSTIFWYMWNVKECHTREGERDAQPSPTKNNNNNTITQRKRRAERKVSYVD